MATKTEIVGDFPPPVNAWGGMGEPHGISSRLLSSSARPNSSRQEATACALTEPRSLRSLAVEFGVSHETIRTVVRQVHLKVE
jgi:hypothetical protein